MKPHAIALCLFLGLASCAEPDASDVDAIRFEEMTFPPMNTENGRLIDVLNQTNQILQEEYPNHPYLPLIVESHDHPDLDLGNTRIDFELPEQDFFERLRTLSEGTMSHWKRSENGFIIFKTWHRPQFEYDDR